MATPSGPKPGYDLTIKLLMLGSSDAKKSALLLRWAEDTFSPSFITTVGIDFKLKMVAVHGTRVRVQVWDTAGQERFRTVTTSYLRGAHGVVLVVNMSDRASLETARGFARLTREAEYRISSRVVFGHITAPNEREVVSREELSTLAEEVGADGCFIGEARTGENVDAAFMRAVTCAVERLPAPAPSTAPRATASTTSTAPSTTTSAPSPAVRTWFSSLLGGASTPPTSTGTPPANPAAGQPTATADPLAGAGPQGGSAVRREPAAPGANPTIDSGAAPASNPTDSTLVPPVFAHNPADAEAGAAARPSPASTVPATEAEMAQLRFLLGDADALRSVSELQLMELRGILLHSLIAVDDELAIRRGDAGATNNAQEPA